MPVTKPIFNKHKKPTASVAREPSRITPVHGKSFDAPARTVRGTFLLNLHKNHRDVAQRIADERALQIEFRDDAKRNDGTPDPNRYAVHVVGGPYDRDEILFALNDAILRAWIAAKQNALAAQNQNQTQAH